jgi:hypothetical protein
MAAFCESPGPERSPLLFVRCGIGHAVRKVTAVIDTQSFLYEEITDVGFKPIELAAALRQVR